MLRIQSNRGAQGTSGPMGYLERQKLRENEAIFRDYFYHKGPDLFQLHGDINVADLLEIAGNMEAILEFVSV